jgi:Helix-turn-helix of insertion element transposase
MVRPVGTRKPLDWRHRRAITLLVWGRGYTKEMIAEECEVSRMALWKWEQREDFRQALEKEYREMQRIMSRGRPKRR